MSPPKFTHYELKLEGDENIMAFLKDHLPATFPTIAEANAVRRAVAALFGGAVTCDIVSVSRVPAQTRRRVLRVK